MSRKYAVIEFSSFNKALEEGLLDLNLLFDNILESNINTLRYSNDKKYFVIKSNSEEKEQYLREKAHELNITYYEYSYKEILQLLATPEWISPIAP